MVQEKQPESSVTVLAHAIKTGLAAAEVSNAFERLREQPALRTLIGIVIGQQQSFEQAKCQRRRLCEHLGEYKSDAADCAKLLLNSEIWNTSKVSTKKQSVIKTILGKTFSLCFAQTSSLCFAQRSANRKTREGLT